MAWAKITPMDRGSILCVGKDIDLLTARCRVLAFEGYSADWATPDDFLQKLSVGRFDLVILSAVLSDNEKRHIQVVLPANVRTIDLDRLIFPAEAAFGVGVVSRPRCTSSR